MHARAVEALEPLGVTEALVGAGRRLPAVALHDRDKALLRIDRAGPRTAYPFILALPQNETEAIPTQRLEALGGAWERGHERYRGQITRIAPTSRSGS